MNQIETAGSPVKEARLENSPAVPPVATNHTNEEIIAATGKNIAELTSELQSAWTEDEHAIREGETFGRYLRYNLASDWDIIRSRTLYIELSVSHSNSSKSIGSSLCIHFKDAEIKNFMTIQCDYKIKNLDASDPSMTTDIKTLWTG